MSYLGDMTLGSTINFKFTTIGTTGLPTQLAATTATTISVYPSSSTTQITAGATLTTDFDGVTGLNAVSIAATGGNGFAVATDYQAVLATGTVGGVNVLGYVVAQFSIQNRDKSLAVGAINSATFSAGAIVATTHAAGAITSTVLAAGAIHSTIFTTGAIAATTFVSGAITSSVLAAGAIHSTIFTTGTIAATTFVAGAITSTVLAAGSIHSTIFTTGAITNSAIAAGAITSATLAAGTIHSTIFTTGAIAATTFIGGAITSTVLAPGAIHSTIFTTGAIAPTTFVAGAITSAVLADAAIDRATLAPDTGLQTIRSGAAQSASATTLVLDSGASATGDFYVNNLLYVTSGTGAGQARFITAYNGTTKVASVSAWATSPDTASTFAVIPFDAIQGATAPTAAEVATAVWDAIQTAHVSAGSFGLLLDSTISTAQADLDNIQTRLPAALVGGRMDSDVAVIQANVITSATIANAAIDAAAFSAGAITSTVLAPGAIHSTIFTTGSIAATTFVAGAITSTVLAAGSIHSTIFTTGAIAATTFVSGAITSSVLAPGAIHSTIFTTGSIAATTFIAGSILATTFGAGAITSTVLAPGAIHSTIFTTGSIAATTFVSGAIVATTHAAGAITSTVLAQGAIHSTIFTTGAIVATTFAGVLPTNFSNMSISAGGLVAITSSIKQNAIATGFMFVMTDMTSHVPVTGLTVVGERSIDGAAFAALANSVAEVGFGVYVVDLAAADTNGRHIMYHFTNATADDMNIEIITQP